MSKEFTAYFVSDIHLGSGDEPNFTLFANWLSSLVECPPSHLFLVGDIFDLWIEDHLYFKQRYKKIIDSLVELKRAGVEIHYFEGNHDLYLVKYWKNELGFFVHEESLEMNLGPWVVRVEHGDQMDPDDKGYLFLRWFLRTTLMRWVAAHLPESLIVKIGESASKKSRKYTSEVKTVTREQTLEKIRYYAMQEAKTSSFDWLISGHVHEWDEFEFEIDHRRVSSINLGTWLKQPCFFKLTPTGGTRHLL